MGFATRSCFASLSPYLHAHYTLVEEIGIGGSGFVLKVRRRGHLDVDREAPLALKVISRDRIPRQNLVRTGSWGFIPHGFEEHELGGVVVPTEAYCLRRLAGHPGVCAFHDLFADETFFYLVRRLPRF